MTLGRFLFVAVLLAGVSAGATQPAVAEIQGPSVVGVVDFERVIRDSAAGRALRQQIDARRTTFQAEVADAEGKLRAEEQELKQQQAVLDPTMFDERRQAFLAKVNQVQRLVQTRRQTLDGAYSSGVEEIKKVAIAIIGEFAKERGFNLVMPLSQVLLVGPGYDITVPVLEELNRRLPTVTVSFDSE